MSTFTPTAENFAKPESITGGCLCGSIRYKVDFPKDHDFLGSSSTCQCTQCRRNTGTLIWYAHSVPVKNLSYTTPTSTLKNFAATKGIQRGICTNCGSFLYWKRESSDNLALGVGTVDPEYLIGDDNNPNGYGYALASCSGPNVFCENEIIGVTKGLVGKTGNRWAKDDDDGIPA
ncbi:putative CENP-V/GFA domain-containing protein [Seiridium cardinale]